MKERIVKQRVVMNATRRPVHLISDRAKRYRANSERDRPPGRRQCGFCGRVKNIGVHHVDGNESHGDTANLMYACKSCNGKVGALLKRARIGRRVVQTNPAKGSRASQMKAYGDAIKVMRGQFDGDIASAVATIQSTPPDVRSAYTSRSWPVRRQMYGPSGRQGGLPF